jgi:putative addiction module killer protein
MLVLLVIDVREYIDVGSHSPYGQWFVSLNPQSRAKVAIALTRIEQGNLSNIKTVGGGVLEYRIDFGPGYRIYLGRDGNRLIVLLGGGTKKRQQRDIEKAKALWRQYKHSERRELTWH